MFFSISTSSTPFLFFLGYLARSHSLPPHLSLTGDGLLLDTQLVTCQSTFRSLASVANSAKVSMNVCHDESLCRVPTAAANTAASCFVQVSPWLHLAGKEMLATSLRLRMFGLPCLVFVPTSSFEVAT